MQAGSTRNALANQSTSGWITRISVIYLIIDLDRPSAGFITNNQQPIIHWRPASQAFLTSGLQAGIKLAENELKKFWCGRRNFEPSREISLDFKFSPLWGWVAKRLQHTTIRSGMTETGRQAAVVVYVVVMVAIIVGVDFAFFRNHFWERLTVNIGIVLMFAAFYWRFLSRN